MAWSHAEAAFQVKTRYASNSFTCANGSSMAIVFLSTDDSIVDLNGIEIAGNALTNVTNNDVDECYNDGVSDYTVHTTESSGTPWEPSFPLPKEGTFPMSKSFFQDKDCTVPLFNNVNVSQFIREGYCYDKKDHVFGHLADPKKEGANKFLRDLKHFKVVRVDENETIMEYRYYKDSNSETPCTVGDPTHPPEIQTLKFGECHEMCPTQAVQNSGLPKGTNCYYMKASFYVENDLASLEQSTFFMVVIYIACIPVGVMVVLYIPVTSAHKVQKRRAKQKVTMVQVIPGQTAKTKAKKKAKI
jgi:hypothetical protein